MTETVVMQWAFNQRSKSVWSAPDEFSYVIDVPEGTISRELIGRIDSFVAVYDRPDPEEDEIFIADQPCIVKMMRIDGRRIEFRFDPPNIRYAYRRWSQGRAQIIGDAGLWLDTFILEENT
jgi:hypothetical protein